MAIHRSLVVEVLTASGRTGCQKEKAPVRELIHELNDTVIQYRETNVGEKIDYAVRLGVTRTPSIALNGVLVFPLLPSKTHLYQAILQRQSSE